ncbi:hypothetical protein B0T24DRAFT_524293 [Lasiosphaeria ovina]|uniref:Translation initiation factor IF-2, mitochondrial n=1 Tax=Lasiosphaeria ovina TaxID=92902 RepID=A0AAE0NB00_9PEZI|nr:hypothetical protein B0T24DRAFT_524293 [Lasiosphaeria ovina]
MEKLPPATDWGLSTKPPGQPVAVGQGSKWEDLVRLTSNSDKPEVGSSGPSSWDWVDKHADAVKPQHRSAIGSFVIPSHSFHREDDSVRRRRDRNDRVANLERTKKARPQYRSQGGEEDEDFDDEAYRERRRLKAEKKAEKERQKQLELEQAGPIPIMLPQFISVANLAAALGVKVDLFLEQLGELGFQDVSREHILTGETAGLVAQEYGFEPTVDEGEEDDLKPRPAPEDPASLPLRPPVVTIMGHVDHGKTTLLDWLRKSSIVSQEHGGITQHIGAFSVTMSTGKPITFLDTPGHAAFLTMRQRGAQVTDIVVLVVAADDSVKPQTIEALKHARAAKVPIIVAINKIDKDDANVERVKSDLAAQGVEIEDYGGDVQVVCVSGKTGLGMADFEENILLLSEMLDIRAETDGMAEGWVLESSIKPIGRVATVLVKRGTLRPGDFVVAGDVAARIRTLRNEAGHEIGEAPPGTAVEILGWKEPPNAGDLVLQAPNENRAKRAARYRTEQKEREEAVSQMTQQGQERRDREQEKREKAIAEGRDRRGRGALVPAPALAPAEAEAEEPKIKVVNFVVKGDVHGSVEAVCASVLEVGSNEVRPRILQSGTGQITESDVEHAATSESSIINFNNSVPAHIRRMADDAGVKILDHNIIYHLVEEIRGKLSEMLEPLVTIKVVGEAEVLKLFPINLKGRVFKNIAGCRVRNGQITRNSTCRVIRDGEEVFKGSIDTLKNGKKDMAEMRKGSECGISLEEWDELRVGDNIQVIEEIKEKRWL